MEVKKHLGVLAVERTALAELLLQSYYLLHGHSQYSVGERCVGCLADFNTFHYFRLDVPTTLIFVVYLYVCDMVL